MIPPFVRTPDVFQALFPSIRWCGSAAGKTIFLTFDDGPHPLFTPAVLDILRAHDAHGTFFVTGRHARAHPDIVERILKAGHTLGNHSYDHQPMVMRPRSWVRDQLLCTQDRIRQAVGSAPRLFRPPYGLFDRRLLRTAQQSGLQVVIWSLVPYDIRVRNPSRITGRVLAKVRPGDIVDLHDGHANSGQLIEALPELLSQLQTRGLDLVGLEDTEFA